VTQWLPVAVEEFTRAHEDWRCAGVEAATWVAEVQAAGIE
jgi:hypothetical protein